MEKDATEILEVVNFIKDRMATKDDLAELRQNVDELRQDMNDRFEAVETRLTSIESELRDIRKRIEILEEAVHNVSGFAKEIDNLMERVRAIETHLNIKPKVAA